MSQDRRIGTTLGDYAIESLLGRGGMSVVYLATHSRLDRPVALKVMAEELSDNEAFRTRFIREAKMSANLEHSNIVPVYDAGEIEGVLYLAMRVIRGTDLRRVIGEGPMDAERALSVIKQVASALDAAHRAGLVHRDVKPGNVLLAVEDEQEHAYLTDFGLTKHVSSKSGLTKTGQFMGTIDYVAPEQIRGDEVDGRTDQYSLGCVLFECITGEVPFQKEQDVATLFAHLEDDPPSVSGAHPSIPGTLDEVIARAMSKRKEDRFPTCSDFARAALAAVAADREPTVAPLPPVPGSPDPTTPARIIPAPPAGPIPPPAPAGGSPPSGGGIRWRRWVNVVGIAAIAFVLLGVVGIVLGLGEDERDPSPAPTASAPTQTPGVSPRPTGSTGPGSTGPTGTDLSAAGCTGTPAPARLDDGTYFGFIPGIDVASGEVGFDLACFYQGEEANRQAADRGDEVPVPNDFYIVNDNPAVRDLPLAPQADLVLIDWHACCEPSPGATLEGFAAALGGSGPVDVDGRLYAGSLSPYRVTIDGGEVVRIQEQYLP